MQFFNVLWFTIRRLLGDTKNNLIKIGMPILLMVILGSALGSAFNVENYDMAYVGYINSDTGDVAETIVDMLSNDDTLSEMIKFIEISSLEEGQDLVNTNEISAVLVFDDEFSTNYENGDEVGIEVYSSKYTGSSMIVIKNVLESYSNVVNTVNALVNVEKNEEAGKFISENYDEINQISLSRDSEITSAIDYYAVTMLVFVLFYGTQYGCECIGEDYMSDIGKRIMSAPVRLPIYFAGKVTGVCIVNFVQGIVLMLVASYGYHVSWGNSLPVVLGLTFSFSVLVTAIGALFCMVTKNPNKASMVLTILVPAMTFISGGFTKFDSGLLKYVSPGYYVQDGIFSAVYNGSESSIIMAFAVIWGLAIVAGLTTILIGRRVAK